MQQILQELKIKADVARHETNGIISRYYLRLHPGGKVNKIERCAVEIALALKSYSIPMIKVIPELGLVSVELLVKPQEDIGFAELIPSLMGSSGALPVILGMDYAGADVIGDITNMPHLLVAGTTGSGKSVLLHSIISSLIIKKDTDVRIALIDPKNVEFSYYKNIRQLLYPIANYMEEANDILSDLVVEMDERFKKMARASVNDIQHYNAISNKRTMPYIVLVIDEFADLMQRAKKEFQAQLSRLAQKSRACGIHIIISTQRPSADVVTGVIKANFPARISCKVTSAINSRVVLDANGAEKLLGRGDALINSSDRNMLRFKGAYLSSNDIEGICSSHSRGRWGRIINYLRGIR